VKIEVVACMLHLIHGSSFPKRTHVLRYLENNKMENMSLEKIGHHLQLTILQRPTLFVKIEVVTCILHLIHGSYFPKRTHVLRYLETNKTENMSFVTKQSLKLLL
jgi:hypothetical protein